MQARKTPGYPPFLMNGLPDIALLFSCIALGFFLVRLRLAPPPRVTDFLLKASLWFLLLIMGYRLGSDPSLVSRLGEIGLLALVSAGLAVLGTLSLLLAADRLIRGLGRGNEAESKGDSQPGAHHRIGAGMWRRFRAPLVLLALVVAGFLMGRVLPRPVGFDFDALCAWALRLLLFFIGMQFAQAGISLKESLLDPAVLVIPLATALGSILPGFIIAPLFGLGLGPALALQAGFGWYSLSGVLIASLGDPVLGSASFLSNLAREVMAFALIPFLARSKRPWLGIGVGGATAMDVTLPIVEQCAGPQWVPASFTSGALLSTLVPLLVPLLYGM